MIWSYGLTTVPRRRTNVLPRTLASLKDAGFDKPTLFVDGISRDDATAWEREFGLPVVNRSPQIGAFGNWVLGLVELCIRNPRADRFAIFQDDFVTYPNLRQYLERSNMPEDGYCNLYSFPSNEIIRPKEVGWYEARPLEGKNATLYHGKPGQTNRGAVALVFSRAAVIKLFSSEHLATKPFEARDPTKRIDGCVGTALNKAGFREYVHNPSLVQHTGAVSAMGNLPHKKSQTFRGENFDAMRLTAVN